MIKTPEFAEEMNRIIEANPTMQGIVAKLQEVGAYAAITAKNTLDLSEAALYTGFTEQHLYRLTSGKQIPHYKKGRKLYFSKAELDEWLQAARVASEAELNSQAATYLATR